MDKIKLEVCCGSYEDAAAAHKGGADRIELNSALWLGGLTPSIGSLALCKEEFDTPIIAMVRPRGGGFCYTDAEYKVICRDAELLLKQGADGIAFGFLDQDKRISQERTENMAQLINYYKKEAVFHRAFDCTADKDEAIQILIELKIKRILTSGGEGTACQGIPLLKELNMRYKDKIEILPGSGINKANAIELVEATGVNQIHSSCKSWKEDITTISESVTFAYGVGENTANYEIVDQQKVVEFKNVLERQN